MVKKLLQSAKKAYITNITLGWSAHCHLDAILKVTRGELGRRKNFFTCHILFPKCLKAPVAYKPTNRTDSVSYCIILELCLEM